MSQCVARFQSVLASARLQRSRMNRCPHCAMDTNILQEHDEVTLRSGYTVRVDQLGYRPNVAGTIGDWMPRRDLKSMRLGRRGLLDTERQDHARK